jgi:hypothetical protein
MMSAAIVHLTSVVQPATGTGGNRARERRELMRASLRSLPGPTGSADRRRA